MSDTTEVPKQNYTKSAIIDKIADEFKKDKELDTIIYNLQFQKATLAINPTRYPTLLEICATSPEEVKIYVKEAIIKTLQDYGTPKNGVDFVRDYFEMKLVFDDAIPLDNLTAEHEGVITQSIIQVVSVGRRESYIKEIQYLCPKCQATETRKIQNLMCPNCKVTMEAVKTVYGDTIIVEVQQPYDDVTVQPVPYTAQFFDDDVFDIKIGDMKKIVFVRKSLHKKTSDRRKIILHVISSTETTSKEPRLPDEQLKKQLHELTGDTERYLDLLTRSIAPNIIYQALAKQACLLAVIGGTPQKGIRSNLHALICGDPSEAKTTIIKFFCRLPYQKTGFAVGGQASGQGITVAMTKLADGTSFPRAGVLTLCTDGYVGVDEFNLIKDEDLDKARECMEDGEIHYDKGGFMLKLTANTTILAGMNPRWHFYDTGKSMKENLNIPLPILSRFDIRVNVSSQRHDITKQRRVISHIYNVKSDGIEDYLQKGKLLTSEEMSLLINYARTFKPIANNEIREKLIKFYIKQKELEITEGRDARQLRIDYRTGRSLLLLAEAFARLFLSDTVTEKHCDMALSFYKDCLRTFGVDPDLGLVQTLVYEGEYTPTSAFEEVAIRLEHKNPDGHFSEEEITKELLEKFPTLFKFDYVVHEKLNELCVVGKVTTKCGRYKCI